MRYKLREKIWSIRDRYVIRDTADEELFVLEGKLLTLAKKLTFSSSDGRELARIEQKLLALRPTFFLLRDGLPTARIRRMLRPIFKPRFEVEVPGEETIVVTGNLWAHEFEFLRGSTRIGYASKKVFSWSDSYGIDLDDDEDQVLLLAATAIVDLVSHSGDGGAGGVGGG